VDDIAYGPTGRGALFYGDGSGVNGDRVRLVDADQHAGADVEVYGPTHVGLGDPAVAVDRAGTATAVFRDDDDGAHTRYARRISADGDVGPLLTIEAQTNMAAAQIVDGPEGTTTLVWQDTGGPVMRRIDPAGALGPTTTLAPSGVPGRVAPHPDGSVDVVWTAHDDNSPYADAEALYTRRIAPDGSLGPIEPAGLTGRPYLPPHALAAMPDGGAVLAWQDGFNGPLSIHVRRIGNDGAPGPITTLTPQPTDDPDQLHVASAPDGSVMTTWSANLKTGPSDPNPRGVLQAARLAADGTVTRWDDLGTPGELALVADRAGGFTSLAEHAAGVNNYLTVDVHHWTPDGATAAAAPGSQPASGSAGPSSGQPQQPQLPGTLAPLGTGGGTNPTASAPRLGNVRVSARRKGARVLVQVTFVASSAGTATLRVDHLVRHRWSVVARARRAVKRGKVGLGLALRMRRGGRYRLRLQMASSTGSRSKAVVRPIG
jgi:hypothetical protein